MNSWRDADWICRWIPPYTVGDSYQKQIGEAKMERRGVGGGGCWWERGDTRSLIHCWWACKTTERGVALGGKTVFFFLSIPWLLWKKMLIKHICVTIRSCHNEYLMIRKSALSETEPCSESIGIHLHTALFPQGCRYEHQILCLRLSSGQEPAGRLC